MTLCWNGERTDHKVWCMHQRKVGRCDEQGTEKTSSIRSISYKKKKS